VWTQEPVCMVWEQNESLFPAKTGTLDRPIAASRYICYSIPTISHNGS
jgi:hypothetical protein